MTKNVFVFASDAAACIGANPYRPRKEALLAAFKRHAPEAYARSGLETCTDRAEKLLSDLPVVKDEIARSVASTNDRNDVRQNTERILTNVDGSDKLSKTEKKDVAAYVRSGFNTAMGIRQESGVLNACSDWIGTGPIVKDDVLHKRVMGKVGDMEWILGGRVDGLTEEGHVVEIKNRVRRLFNKIPDYEKVQVMCYMHLVDAPRAYLVEKNAADHAVHSIEFDHDAFEEIRSGLEAFVSDLVGLMDHYK